MAREDYEVVIGLEVHAELSTKTKIFCSCPTEFGAKPNTHTCPICMAMPGTLPVLNEKVVEYAVKAGLATNCSISKDSKNDRKNYFYPDLPKSYQISQFDKPLCNNGYIEIEEENGEKKKIRILRIHIEEDAGKLNHNEFSEGSLVDLNRAGVPLIEIVSEPDLRSAKEADATQFSPSSDGKLVINGIEGDEYGFTETHSDAGYSLLKKEVIVKVKETKADITPTEANITGIQSKSDADSTANDGVPNGSVLKNDVTVQTTAASATVDETKATMTKHDDSGNAYSQFGQRVDVLPSQTLFSPATRLGFGFNRSIKPDILMPGGRQLYNAPMQDSSTLYSVNNSIIAPGQKVALHSSNQGDLNSEAFWRGTSNATALATRGAVRLYDMLDRLRN